ncbi:hypothetical protein, partial [Streptomyces sp. DSM 15324]|uniref:hypothetical protein n=1 Tax=Streptomyces sp. DSM 15324 TaxID=1739111 RepID=UPI001F2EF92B
LADAAFVGSTVSDSDTFSLVIDASSMIGSYTERLTVPGSGLSVRVAVTWAMRRTSEKRLRAAERVKRSRRSRPRGGSSRVSS